MSIRRLLAIAATLALALSLLCGTLILLQAEPVQATATTRYVSPNSDCGVVVPCYGSIQHAIDDSISGDVIKVSQGVYTSVLSNVVFISKSIEILGGFSTIDWGNSEPAEQPSVIDGEGTRRGIRVQDTGDSAVTLAGFTIRNGLTITEGGGGILVISGTIDLSSSYVMNNSAVSESGHPGGGIALVSSTALIIGNTIYNNQAGAGGGVSIDHSNVELDSNIIKGNSADMGGGLLVFGQSRVNFDANIVLANTSPVGFGPGILLNDNSTITGQNDVIAGNQAAEGEGEGVNIWMGRLEAFHWTIVDNEGYGLVASNGNVYLYNTIVVSHSVAGIFGDVVQADTTLFYSNGENCSSGASCSGNLQGDPLFVNPENSDYHIMKGSAAEDAGTYTNVYVDIDGDPRPSGAGPDIGADEIAFGIFMPFVTNIDPAD